MKQNISESLQNYLEMILILSKQNKEIRCVDIADNLKVSRASVNKAINQLKTKQLVNQEHYGTVSLTPLGYEIATQVDNYHQLIKTFLVKILEVDEKTAEIDACKIEHAISKKTAKKLEEFINKY